MNDDQYFLANAYLDGELTADERAIAEADPEVMSEVEQLRALQAQMRDVEPPTEAARDTAIAAAMAEFSPVAATPPPERHAAPRVVPFRPRPAYSRYLAIAAAVVAIGVLGVVVVNGVDRGGDDDSGADFSTADAGDDSGDDSADDGDAVDAADEPAVSDREMTDELLNGAAEAAGDAADSDDSGDDSADDGAAEAAAPAATSVASEGDDSGDDSGFDAGDDSAGDTAAQIDDLPPGVIPVLRTERVIDQALLPEIDLLTLRGAELLTLLAEGDLPADPNTNCAFPDADDPARILSRDEFVVDAGITELFVAVDESRMLVYGISPDTCEILIDGLLP